MPYSAFFDEKILTDLTLNYTGGLRCCPPILSIRYLNEVHPSNVNSPVQKLCCMALLEKKMTITYVLATITQTFC